MKILSFDIDGVLLSYNDEQRSLLANGSLEDSLKRCTFAKLVCVSRWFDILNTGLTQLSDIEEKQFVYEFLDQIFIDKDWFFSRLALVYDTDHRCKHIDSTSDWYYIDDWAD